MRFPSLAKPAGLSNQSKTPAKTKKSFSWSFSALRAYETCPHKYYRVSVLRDVKESESGALVEGQKTHEALAAALQNGSPLPDSLVECESYIQSFKKLRDAGLTILVEHPLAITASFEPCDMLAKGAWLRCVVDAGAIGKNTALVVDWKTGRPSSDTTQLLLMSLAMFCHYPDLQSVDARFLWLSTEEETAVTFTRQDAHAQFAEQIAPRVGAFKHAVESRTFPPTPNFLCKKHCPVVDCSHNGAYSNLDKT